MVAEWQPLSMADVEARLPAQANGASPRLPNLRGVRINAVNVTRQARDPPGQPSITAPDLQDAGAGEGRTLDEPAHFQPFWVKLDTPHAHHLPVCSSVREPSMIPCAGWRDRRGESA
jgi:hypothetical protein